MKLKLSQNWRTELRTQNFAQVSGRGQEGKGAWGAITPNLPIIPNTYSPHGATDLPTVLSCWIQFVIFQGFLAKLILGSQEVKNYIKANKLQRIYDRRGLGLK